MGIIYKAINIKNGKIYIGKTIDSLENRRKSHYSNLKYLHTYFTYAIKKYGKEFFLWEIIEECENELLNDREKYYITFFNTKIPNGYNMTEGGDGAAIGDLNVSKREDVKIKLREKSSGFKHSDKTKKLLSNLTKKQFENGMSDEIKQKISKSCKGHFTNKGENSNLSKTYYIMTPNGEKIKITGMRNFCEENDLDHSSMIKVARGKLKHYKGYKVFYHDIQKT